MQDHRFIDDTARQSWKRATGALPSLWQQAWVASLDAADPDGAVIQLVGDVIKSCRAEALTLRQAADALRPLFSHPVVRAWPDGEFIAIALDADAINGSGPTTLRDDLYHWHEIEASYQRIVNAVAGADDAPPR